MGKVLSPPSSSAIADALPSILSAVSISSNAVEMSSELPPALDELAAYLRWLYNGHQQFTLGQHKGRMFQEVAVEDPSYGTVSIVDKHDSE